MKGATATSTQEGLYWRYERRVRELESRAGLLTAVTGALLAVRSTAYRPVPPTASMDHLLPLYVREAGGLVVYVPGAVATDRPISGLREQLRNRTRTATRGIRANLSMVGRAGALAAAGSGRGDLVAQAAALGDAVVRRWWSRGAGLVLGLGGQPAYLVAPLAVATLGGSLAAAAHLLIGAGRHPRRVVDVRPLVRGRQRRVRDRLAQRHPRPRDRGLAPRGVARRELIALSRRASLGPPVGVERLATRHRARPPRDPGRPAATSSSRRSIASTIPAAIDATSSGSTRTAAPPAVSGSAETADVTTGAPAAIASRTGKPKPS